MFAFDLKLTQAWFTVALLLLSFSVCRHSCYPHTEEDEDTTEVEEKLDSDEDQESVHNDDDDEDLKEEEEEDATVKIRYCIAAEKPCGPSVNSRGLPCCTNQYGDFYQCGISSNYVLNCIKIMDKDIQNELRKRKREEVLNYKPEESKNQKPEDVKKRQNMCDWYCKKTLKDRRGFGFVTRYCSCS